MLITFLGLVFYIDYTILNSWQLRFSSNRKEKNVFSKHFSSSRESGYIPLSSTAISEKMDIVLTMFGHGKYIKVA